MSPCTVGVSWRTKSQSRLHISADVLHISADVLHISADVLPWVMTHASVTSGSGQ